MNERERRFHDARDATEFALGGAFASIEEARTGLEVMATTVEVRSEVDALRGAVELLAYATEGLAVAVGQLSALGERIRPADRSPRTESTFRAELSDEVERIVRSRLDPIKDERTAIWVSQAAERYEIETGPIWDRLLAEVRSRNTEIEDD